jgi:predicted amidohydrolase
MSAQHAMSDTLMLAAVQMVSGPGVADNLHLAEQLIARAAAEGARLIALPEYFPLIGASDAERLAARERDVAAVTAATAVTAVTAVVGRGDEAPIQHFLADCARRHGVWLVGGSIPLAGDDPGRLKNSCLVYGPAGQRVARYDKMHLFSFRRDAEEYDEQHTIEAGSGVVTFETPGLEPIRRVGLAICYDLRFPELFRAMGPVDLLVIPAAFTETTGRAHWELLLRARAVENQCYVLAAAQGGTHPNGRVTHGHSMLVDPWGDIVARLPQGPGVVLGAFDRARLMEVRASLPALRHRRL